MNSQLDLSQIKTPAKTQTTPTGQIIAIASGKGGVGKTSLTLNLARTLAKKGQRVLVFDADLGLANIDVQLSITPEKDLSAVLQGEASVKEIITPVPNMGFDVIAGRSGSETLPFTTTLERHNILSQLTELTTAYDIILLDIAAGVGDEVLTFANLADRTILIITPDPSSITDGYAVIKLLQKRHHKNNCEILINQAHSQHEGKLTYEKIHMAAHKFLTLEVPLFGIMPYDKNYLTAVKQQGLMVDLFPHLKGSDVVTGLVEKLIKKHSQQRV